MRPRLDLPQPHTAVPTPTGEGFAVGAERQAQDMTRMSSECLLRCACLRTTTAPSRPNPR